MRRRRERAEAGYLLVEALIVLALVGLIALSLGHGLRMGSRLLTASSHAAASLSSQLAVRELLRRTIAEAYPAVVLDRRQLGTLVFRGAEDHLVLVAPLPEPFGKGNLARIALHREGDRLLLRWVAENGHVLLPDGLPASARHHVLLTGVSGFAVHYLGRDQEGREAWYERWASQDHLPRLVKLSLTFTDNSGPHLPDLIVPMRIDVPAHCVYEFLSIRCRGR